MPAIVRFCGRMLAAVLVVLVTTACTSPTGTTKDIFDVTSSTTDRTWFTIDGTVQDDYRVITFTTINFTVLKQEMAQGEGEYLTSFEALLGVPPARHAEFAAWMQDRYTTLLPSAQTTAADMLASLERVLKASPRF